MNYLAHLYLSGRNTDLLTGNFLGDSLRGAEVQNLPEEIRNGVKLHYFIDQFTDSHPLFHEARRCFEKEFPYYNGVLVDIYFDHLLAENFLAHTNEDLENFNAFALHVLNNNKQWFNYKAGMFYQYVIKYNIFVKYAEQKGIVQVLNGLTHRIKNREPLATSYPLFLDNKKMLDENFTQFWSEIKAAINKEWNLTL